MYCRTFCCDCGAEFLSQNASLESKTGETRLSGNREFCHTPARLEMIVGDQRSFQARGSRRFTSGARGLSPGMVSARMSSLNWKERAKSAADCDTCDSELVAVVFRAGRPG